MSCRSKAAFLAVLLTGIATSSFAAAPAEKPADAAAVAEAAKKSAPTLDAVVGKKLTAIDGSTILLTPSESGIQREIVGSNGAVQKTTFGFINDKLGTVIDAKNSENVTGVFRATGAGLEIQYADGSSETVAANSGGGITIESISAGADTCTAWYPEGHQFSVEERRAALALFAVRLGLADAGEKKTAETAGKVACGGGAAAAPSAVQAKDTPAKTEAPVRAATGVPRALATPSTAAVAAGVSGALAKTDIQPVKNVEVRASEVHPIDAPAAEAQKPQTADVAEAVAKTVAADKAADKPQIVANADAKAKPTSAEIGASQCLRVESDGAHWGFRNHCGYSVQFAYCQMSGNSQLASCRDGSLSGSVAANGFGSLVADDSLSEKDAVHDFRWVACQGGAGEVVPRLDQIDPPAGRCVH